MKLNHDISTDGHKQPKYELGALYVVQDSQKIYTVMFYIKMKHLC